MQPLALNSFVRIISILRAFWGTILYKSPVKVRSFCILLAWATIGIGPLRAQTFDDEDSSAISSVLSPRLFEFGGGLSLATGAVRGQGGSTAFNPPQSRLRLVVEPELNYFINKYISGGLRVGLEYLLREDVLPMPRGMAVMARQNNYSLLFGVGCNAYQAVLRRLYLYERLGFDIGTGTVRVNLLDMNDEVVKTGTLNTGTTRLVPEVGMLYFVRSNVALKVMLAYQVSWVTVSAFEDPGNDLDIWLPRGDYLDQGLMLKIGLGFFFKGPVKSKEVPSNK